MTRSRTTGARLGPALALLAATAFAGAAHAETLWVRSESASLKATASPSAAEVATLARGAELSVLGRDGSWVQVQGGGKTGWVHKLKLGPEKPSDGGTLLAGLGGSRDDYVREAQSGRGARGLEESTERYAAAEQVSPATVQTVERMQKIQVSDQEVERFLKQGGLGEWSP